jgi:uncharacterized integral membrane protein
MVGMSSSEPLVPPRHDIEPLPPHPSAPDPLPVESYDEPPLSAPPVIDKPAGKEQDKRAKGKSALPPNEASKFTRAGALWSALAVGFLILVLLLVFIVQNGDSTTIHMFGWAWQLPVGVALLLAAIAGGLLTFLAGSVRILQLRRAAKKNLKAGL